MIWIASVLITLAASVQTQLVYAPRPIPQRFLHAPYHGSVDEYVLEGRNRYLPRTDSSYKESLSNPTSTLPLNLVPESRKVAKVVASSVSSVVPPLCFACKCVKGFKTCQAAGGRHFIENACLGDGTVGSECTFPAPDSLSACDSTCKKSCVIIEEGTYPLIGDCVNIDTANQAQCSSACADLPAGSIVKCNSTQVGVMTAAPSVCGARNQREFKSSVPSTEEENNSYPEIVSSLTSANRQPRLLNLLGLLPFYGRINLFDTGNGNVDYTTGTVTATYVIPDGSCIPSELASVSLCS